MATTMPHVDIVDDKPIVCLRAGESIVQTKPVFSHDTKLVVFMHNLFLVTLCKYDSTLIYFTN